jgi:hypothetical protein
MSFEQTERNQKMMTQRPYCCGNCPAYMDCGDGFTLRSDIDIRMRRGQCRKHPPAVDEYRKWPEVYYLDFCGEHPSAPLTHQEYLLPQINSRLESPEERGEQVMRTAAN